MAGGQRAGDRARASRLFHRRMSVQRGAAARTSQRRVSTWLMVFSLCVSLMGCAHVPPRARFARVLVGTGVVVAVSGGVVSAGCVPDSRPGLCSAGRDDGTVRVGFPILVLGAAIITTAMLLRPRSVRPPTPQIMRHAAPSFTDPYGPPPLNGY
jgi:hypothetical protein